MEDAAPKYLFSADLFREGAVQVFSARTGAYLGTVLPGEALPEDDPEGPETKPEPQKEETNNDNQLNLF